MQRLLNAAEWDVEAVRDDLRAYVVEHLGDASGLLIVDETGFLKMGTKSAGVQRQYSGTAGRIENCQVGVFLAYATGKGQALLDRALYLAQEWADDAARRAEAGVPATRAFATKPALARPLLVRAFAAEIPAAWVTGDEIYGDATDLRHWLEEADHPYVLAVSANHAIWHDGIAERADALVAALPTAAWVRWSAGAGSQGKRLYDWVGVRLPFPTVAGQAQWLLGRCGVGRTMTTARCSPACSGSSRPAPPGVRSRSAPGAVRPLADGLQPVPTLVPRRDLAAGARHTFTHGDKIALTQVS